MLTPKEKGGGGTPPVFPVDILYSALFDGSSDLYFTPGTATDATVWTCMWAMKADMRANKRILSAYTDVYNFEEIRADADGALLYVRRVDGTNVAEVNFGARAVDPTGHSNFVFSRNGTSVKLEKDGVEVPQTVVVAVPSEAGFINTAVEHRIGGNPVGGYKFDGYLSNFHFIDGTAYAASDVGEHSDIVTGLWVWKNTDSLAYGNNGRRYTFNNAVDMGEDSSGNGNNASVNGTLEQTADTPTDNHATLNPLEPIQGTYSDGNRQVIYDSSGVRIGFGTLLIPKSGKWYYEASISSGNGQFGIAQSGASDSATSSTELVRWFTNDTSTYLRGVEQATFPSTPGTSRVGMEIDRDNNEVSFILDSTSYGPYSVTMDGDWLISPVGNSFTGHIYVSSADWSYTPSSGSLPLTSANFPVPENLKSDEAAQVALYTGTGADTDIVTGIAEDLVITKSRSGTYSWYWADRLRGPLEILFSNKTDAETTVPGSITAFNSDGHSIGTENAVNLLDSDVMSMGFKADALTELDASNNVVSQTNNGTTYGLEIVKYAGNGAAGRQVPIVGTMGKAPSMMIVKRLDSTNDWFMYHKALGATKFLQFDSGAAGTGTTVWNDTEPTATDFTVGSASSVNLNGSPFIAYLFTDSDIYRAFSFIGSADYPYVNLGGKPSSIPFVKNAHAAGSWIDSDAARNPFSPIDLYLRPDIANAEATQDWCAFTSQGFKLRNYSNTFNGGGTLHVGLAILESTKYSNAF